MRRVSPKQAKLLREYAKLRTAYLLEHPWCQTGMCGWGTPVRPTPATEVHHKAGRGKNLLRTETWLAVCRNCHSWIEAHPRESLALGFKVLRLLKRDI